MADQEKPVRRGTVVQQATVIFAGAEIAAVLAEDGLVYGALVNTNFKLAESVQLSWRLSVHSPLPFDRRMASYAKEGGNTFTRIIVRKIITSPPLTHNLALTQVW